MNKFHQQAPFVAGSFCCGIHAGASMMFRFFCLLMRYHCDCHLFPSSGSPISVSSGLSIAWGCFNWCVLGDYLLKHTLVCRTYAVEYSDAYRSTAIYITSKVRLHTVPSGLQTMGILSRPVPLSLGAGPMPLLSRSYLALLPRASAEFDGVVKGGCWQRGR